MEPDPIESIPSEPLDGRGFRMAVSGGPGHPTAEEMFRQSGEQGKPPEFFSLLVAKPVEIGIASELSPELLQGGHFQAKDFIPIDSRHAIQIATQLAPTFHARAEQFGFGDLLQAEVEGIEKPPAAGVIRAGFLGREREDGMQRIDQQKTGMQLFSCPPCEPAKITQIADAPT
jgi:hypothetical protein